MPDKPKTEQERVQELAKWQGYLAQVRQPFEEQVNNILEFVMLGEPIAAPTKSYTVSKRVYDSYPVQGMDDWARNFYAHDCASSLPWFETVMPNIFEFPRYSVMRKYNDKRIDEIPEVNKFLSDVQDVLVADIRRSTFYQSIISFLKEGGGPGTAVMAIDEDPTTGTTYYTPLHFRDCWIGRDKFGKIDTVFRKITYTMKTMVEEFGLEKCKEVDNQFADKYQRNPFQEMTVIRAVYPRKMRDPEKKDNENKPWASCWYLEGEKAEKFLRESGTDYFPYITWAYDREYNKMYGRGWAWYAWAEIGSLNVMARQNLEAGGKMANPPMISTDLLRGKERFMAGGVTRMDRIMETDMPRPLVTGINLPYAMELQEFIRKSIDKWSHADVFTVLTQAVMNKVDMTATQVLHIGGEKAALLSSMTDGFNNSALADIIDLHYNRAAHAGRLPPIPQVLLEIARYGYKIEVDFIGPLVQMQKALFKTQGIRAGLAIALEIGAVDPQALMVADWKDALRQALKAVSFPYTSIRAVEQLDVLVAQANKTAAGQQALMEAETMAKMVPPAGKEVSPQSPLGMMMGMGGAEGSA